MSIVSIVKSKRSFQFYEKFFNEEVSYLADSPHQG